MKLGTTQIGILFYLSGSSKVKPYNLKRYVNFSDPTNSEAYEELKSMGLVDDDGENFWLTDKGSTALDSNNHDSPELDGLR